MPPSSGRPAGFRCPSRRERACIRPRPPGREDRLRILSRFGHAPTDVGVRLNRANLECDQCPAAFVRRGLFILWDHDQPRGRLPSGIQRPFLNLSRDLVTLLRELGLSAKQARRAGGYVVYFKESESIEDCLTLMGATSAALELMGVKMVKDIRNNINRVTNCESANIDKTVAAAAVQSEALRKIERTVGARRPAGGTAGDCLSPPREPRASLRELGEALDGRSPVRGVNHRLRRILEFAEKL